MWKNHNDEHTKVLPMHRERMAYLYIRQSSLRQVEQHTEGGQRQYDLVPWLVEQGWPRERIVLVDEDQGKTGTLPEMREGFGRLISAVAQGQVGIVVGLEVSRLARNIQRLPAVITFHQRDRLNGETIFVEQTADSE